MMPHVQPLQLSQDVSTIQATVMAFLRTMGDGPIGQDGDRLIYARWYAKRAMCIQIGRGLQNARPEMETGPPHALGPVNMDRPEPAHPSYHAAAPARPADSCWADQVQRYLHRTGRTVS